MSKVRQSKVKQGKARQGKVKPGKPRQSKAQAIEPARVTHFVVQTHAQANQSKHDHLREFVALHYERHPESMRTVPWLRPAGRDSAPVTSAASAGVFQSVVHRLGNSCFNLRQVRS